MVLYNSSKRYGESCYKIPVGGSSILGTYGFLSLFEELISQVSIAHLIPTLVNIAMLTCLCICIPSGHCHKQALDICESFSRYIILYSLFSVSTLRMFLKLTFDI